MNHGTAPETDTIGVRWRIQNREAKGTITRDPKGREKIVFVEGRYFRGRAPRDGEECDAVVVRDTKPEQLRYGALIVRPIYATEQDAMSEADARAEISKIIATTGPMFSEYGKSISVSLRGWHGTLVGRLCKRPEHGDPLVANWRYEDEDGQRVLMLHARFGDSPPLTTGIKFTRRGYQIMNWQQAVLDLGEPSEVERLPESDLYATVIWKDADGNPLRIQMDRVNALNFGCTFKDVEVEDGRLVKAKLALLDGRWVTSPVFIAYGDSINTDGEVERAHWESSYERFLTEDVRETIARLLQPHRHSPEWYKQKLLAYLLDPTESTTEHFSQRIRHHVRLCEKLLASRLHPYMWLEREFQRLNECWRATNEFRTVTPRMARTTDSIFGAHPASDDSEETARLTATNNAALASVAEDIAVLNLEYAEVPQRRQRPEFRQELRQTIATLRQQESERNQAAGQSFILMELQEMLQAIDNCRFDIENLLYHLNNVRQDIAR